MNIFYKMSNQQITEGDLIALTEQDAINGGFKNLFELEDIFKENGLDIHRAYSNTKNLLSKYIYVGDYASTEIILNRQAISNEYMGLPKIKKRNEFFDGMFKDNEYSLIFNPEYNLTPLYHFIEVYREIALEDVYSVFKGLYQSIDFGFSKLPKECLDYVLARGNVDTEEVIKYVLAIKGDEVCVPLDRLTEIEIYRGHGTESNDIENALSWTLDKNVAREFARRGQGYVLKGVVCVENIIDFLDSTEKEIWVDYSNVNNVEII